jgi:hypothetical protein
MGLVDGAAKVMKGLAVEVPALEVGGIVVHVRPHRVDGPAGALLKGLIPRQQSAASRRQALGVAESRIRRLDRGRGLPLHLLLRGVKKSADLLALEA